MGDKGQLAVLAVEIEAVANRILNAVSGVGSSGLLRLGKPLMFFVWGNMPRVFGLGK